MPNTRKSRTAAKGKGRHPGTYPLLAHPGQQAPPGSRKRCRRNAKRRQPHHLSIGSIDSRREWTPKTAKTTPEHQNDRNDGQGNPTSAGSPNLALPLVEGCGRTQSDENVEAGTEGEHETRTTGLCPSLTATTNAKYPRKDRPATECKHRCERERQQNRESGIDARPTTRPSPCRGMWACIPPTSLSKRMASDNTRRLGITLPF